MDAASVAAITRHTITATLALFACINIAHGQVPGQPGHSPLYFKQNKACMSPPNCRIPASAVFPNTDPYTSLASLTLPPGNYLVTSKLSAFAAGGTSYVNFECALLDSNDAAFEYSSFDGIWEQTLFLQAPYVVVGNDGNTVQIGCRAYGFLPDHSALVDMHVWNVNIAAVRVGPLHLQ